MVVLLMTLMIFHQNYLLLLLVTLLATGHAIVNTVGEVVIGTGKLIVDTGKTYISGLFTT